jgi:cell division protease FtsH
MDNNSNSNGENSNNLLKKVLINIAYLLTVIIVIGLVVTFTQGILPNNENKPTFSDLITEIRDGRVSSIEVSEDKKTLNVALYKNVNQKDRNNVELRQYPNLPVTESSGQNSLQNINEALGTSIAVGTGTDQIIFSEKPKSFLTQLFENPIFQILLYAIVIAIVGLYLVRRITDVNNKTISFGSTRAKAYEDIDSKDKITFQDVAGQAEAKEELMEVVDFLKRPEEYLKMGAKIPRGVLLNGQPGNGKTLMAKAVAGEAGVPFMFVSGSEFVEMFVGVGANRVRDLFKKAKKKSPCVIFIDEIDAVGRQRGVGLGGGNDEREQTLNQILVEMDGFEAMSSVIVIGATNRPDVLDPALLRPGRFDRQVTVNTPDRKERELILQVHSRNKKIAKDVDLGIIAKRTSGFSGADLMSVFNEAAILAVRHKKSEIDNLLLREAIEKVMLGPQLRSKVLTDDQKKLTAYHEGGHALVATVLPKANKVQKVTIMPRGRAGGYTFSDNGDFDPTTRSKSQFLSDITVLFGGYSAEEIIFGEVSTGASNDLSKATEIARNMVIKYGMSALGPLSFASDGGISSTGRDSTDEKKFSQEFAVKIDNEIKNIIESCYNECKKIINENIETLHAIAQSLIENEVLELEEFNKIVAHLLPESESAEFSDEVLQVNKKTGTSIDIKSGLKIGLPKTKTA